ncbi:GroES-like protein [Xylaria sp. FL1042]|nr:GroES-like protein [Xylaria sp. FL1042]
MTLQCRVPRESTHRYTALTHTTNTIRNCWSNMTTSTTPLPSEMHALRVTQFNAPYELCTIPVPEPGPHDLLVKVAVASYCHTDSMVAAGVFKSKLPQTASHEGSGTVVAVGDSVSSFKIGDRVMCGVPLHPCGKCEDCTGPIENHRQYCTQLGHIGVTTQGCAADYVIADARTSTKLPGSVSFLSAAPLACAGRTVYRAVLQTGLKPGQWVAIVGSGGGLGHLGIQFAHAAGLKVVGIDARDEGLVLSREYGADVVVDARREKADVVEEVKAVTDGKGVDSAIVLADHAEALAAAVTRMHGTVVQVAQPDTISVPFAEVVFRDIRFKGTLIASPLESEGMMQCIAEHGIKVRTNPFQGLEKIEELLGVVKSGKLRGKAVIVVDPEQIEADKRIGAKF